MSDNITPQNQRKPAASPSASPSASPTAGPSSRLRDEQAGRDEEDNQPTASPTFGLGKKHATRESTPTSSPSSRLRDEQAARDEEDNQPTASPTFGLGKKHATRESTPTASPTVERGVQESAHVAELRRKHQPITDRKNKYAGVGKPTQDATSQNENLESQMTELYLEMEQHFRGKKQVDWAEAEFIADQLLLWPELPLYFRTRAHMILCCGGHDPLFHAQKAVEFAKYGMTLLGDTKPTEKEIALLKKAQALLENVEKQQAQKGQGEVDDDQEVEDGQEVEDDQEAEPVKKVKEVVKTAASSRPRRYAAE